METAEQREKRLQSIRDKRRQEKEMETPIEREKRKYRENERKQAARKRARHETTRNEENVNEQTREQTRQERNRQEETHIDEEQNSDTNTIPQSATTISEEEIRMLNDFRKKMDDIHYEHCSVCNERIPSMPIVRGCANVATKTRTHQRSFPRKITWTQETYLTNSSHLAKSKKC